jgi:hypothetical protein
VHYRERETPVTRNPIGAEVTAVLRDRGDQVITVISTYEHAPYGDRGDHWQVTVNSVIPEDGVAEYPPSSPWLAHVVYLHLNQVRLARPR